VKSAGPERLPRLALTTSGVVGDRVWAVVDADGTLVSAKHPECGARLLLVGSRYDERTGVTVVDVPGEGELTAGAEEADTALSRWLGRPVRLSNQPAPGQRLRRWWPSQPELVPEWEPGARPGEDAVTTIAGTRVRNSFVDYGAVHLVTTDDLDRLSALASVPVEPTRFRPNVLITGVGPLNAGTRIRIGDALLDIEIATPRCAVPGLSPVNASLQPELLRQLARFDRRQVGRLGTAACFGVYGVPVDSTHVGVDDEVTIL
jgi:uncharacterized protein YcbX